MNDTARFVLKATPLGGTVKVNGQDVSARVAQAAVTITPGQPTVLTIHTLGEGDIEGEGVVQVVAPAQADAEVICAFLSGIDPGQLDNDALNGADASQNLTAAMLATLQRYARGE